MLPVFGLEGCSSRRTDFSEVSVSAAVAQKQGNAFGFQFEQAGHLL